MRGTENHPIPETKAECLALALEWGRERSYHNVMLDLAPDNATGVLLTIQADAAEVAQLSALYPMLPPWRGAGEA